MNKEECGRVDMRENGAKEECRRV